MIKNEMKSDYIKHVKDTRDEYHIREEAKEFPMMCVISLIYVCNAECPNCPYTRSNIRENYRDNLYMEEELFKKIADECGKYGSYIRFTGGGEPMMHPKAVEFMEYAKKVGAKIGLITNGSLFNEEKLIRILKANVDMVEFSVDACDEETYSKVRKGLNWNTLLNNVNKIMELRNQLNSKTKIIVSAINQEAVNLKEVEEFWKPKVDHVQLRKFLTWGIGDESQSGDTTPYLPIEENIPCPWIFERLNIDSKGQIALCGYDVAFDTNLGNINEQSIQDIWKGEKFEEYRKLHMDKKSNEIDICNRCLDRIYRSWNYNYFELVKTAEKNKKKLYKASNKFE